MGSPRQRQQGTTQHAHLLQLAQQLLAPLGDAPPLQLQLALALPASAAQAACAARAQVRVGKPMANRRQVRPPAGSMPISPWLHIACTTPFTSN